MKISGLEIFRDFLSLIYPNYCLACNGAMVKGEEILCTLCLSDMPKTNFHYQMTNPLQERLSYRMPLRYAFAYYYFKKGNKVQALLHQLKYKNHPEIGEKVGHVFGSELLEVGLAGAFDVIIPVPLHTSRKRSRGYNQSTTFAKGLSDELKIPYTENFIKRSIRTQTQTKKSRLKRWLNVQDVFEMKDIKEIHQKRVLLVDDVVTTGATLEACAQSLLKSGCSEISIACIAVA